METEEFAQLLISKGIIQEEAWYSAEDYDGCATYNSVCETLDALGNPPKKLTQLEETHVPLGVWHPMFGSVVRIVLSRYFNDTVLRDHIVSDFLPDNDGGLLVKLNRRETPLTDEELADLRK